MDKWQEWIKLGAAWLATIAGYITEHFPLGKIALGATVVLTLLQAYKVWLDIRLRRRQLEIDDEL